MYIRSSNREMGRMREPGKSNHSDGTVITWTTAPIRYAIFQYLMGIIAALYFMWLEEGLLAVPTPTWMKVVFVSAVFPIAWTLGRIWLYRRAWLR
ncbi:MAG: hypothetical protein P9L99_13525 [Candidatus Lernaella stagnicola]|nr:hypothetical protein [Candidatus Lernaella stagnicola]